MLVIKSQMKRSVRPLLSILFLMLVVAALSFRVPLRHGFVQLRNERPFVGMVNVPFINQTLLEYASVDLSDPQLKKEVEALLEGRFSKQGRQRSFLSAGKYRIDSGADSKSARGLRLPVQLQSPAYYKAWLGFRRTLRDWFRNRRYQADIMLELARLVEQMEGGKKMPTGKKYKSCAVVGNSGILLKSEYGGLIDCHEAVIRLNNARISGFEAKVGKRTTISFVNSHILHLCARRVDCFCHPYGTTVPTVMYICQPAHFLDYIACNSSEKAPWIVTDARFDVLCARIVKYYSVKRFLEKTGKDLEQWLPAHEGPLFHYSSGMQAVMLAVGICDKVSIFGFGKSADSKHHYHTNQKGELSLHDYEAEYELYTDLVTRPRAIPFISDKFKYPPVVMYR